MIKITREKSFRDKLRSYKIIIDGNHYESIKSGEIKNIDISSGKHTLYLKIDWCRSNKIDFYVTDDETVKFECGNSMNGWKILSTLIYITFFKNKYLWIKRKQRCSS